jgi:hypothetical protein
MSGGGIEFKIFWRKIVFLAWTKYGFGEEKSGFVRPKGMGYGRQQVHGFSPFL